MCPDPLQVSSCLCLRAGCCTLEACWACCLGHAWLLLQTLPPLGGTRIAPLACAPVLHDGASVFVESEVAQRLGRRQLACSSESCQLRKTRLLEDHGASPATLSASLHAMNTVTVPISSSCGRDCTSKVKFASAVAAPTATLPPPTLRCAALKSLAKKPSRARSSSLIVPGRAKRVTVCFVRVRARCSDKTRDCVQPTVLADAAQ